MQIGNIATNSADRGRRRMLAVQRRLYRIIKFVRGGSASGMAKFFIPIVDAAVIDELALAVEYRNFRRDFYLAEFDQRMLRVLQRREFVAVFLKVLLDVRAG